MLLTFTLTGSAGQGAALAFGDLNATQAIVDDRDAADVRIVIQER